MKEEQEHLILLAHGSRDPCWCATLESGLSVINRQLVEDASLAYLEMASPSLESVIIKYYMRGTRHFSVLPLFFAQGRHLLHDVPEKIRKMHDQFDGARITLLDAVGQQENFWNFLASTIAKGANGLPNGNDQDGKCDSASA